MILILKMAIISAYIHKALAYNLLVGSEFIGQITRQSNRSR